MTFGVTGEGFVGMPLATIKDEIEASVRDAFGAGVNLAPQSALSSIVGIMSEREALLWELGEAIYLAFDPDAAEGAALDNLMALTGATRLDAVASTVTATATGTAATVLPVGRIVSVVGSAARFATLAEATLVAADAWLASTPYAIGDRVSSNGSVWQATTAGTSGATAPTGTDATHDDGGVEWMRLGLGAAVADVACEAVETGEIPAVAGTLTQIETPVSGWSSVTNLLDADLGRDVETDAAARTRREELLAVAGSSIVDAIRARVRAVTDVDAVAVFENTTDTTDSDGIPPHAFEVLVVGGDADDIAQAIWDTKPAGILAHGDDSGTATDAEGDPRTVAFTVPTPVDVYVVVNVTADGDYPTDGDAQIKAAIVAYGETRSFGDDVIASPLAARVFTVSGVVDVTALYIGTSPAPGASTTIAIDTREIAAFDTSRVTVVAT